MDKSLVADKAYDLALAASYVLAVLDVEPGSPHAVTALKKAGPKAVKALTDVVDDAAAEKLVGQAAQYIAAAIKLLDKDPKAGSEQAVSYLDDVVIVARKLAKKFGDDPNQWKNLTAEARERFVEIMERSNPIRRAVKRHIAEQKAEVGTIRHVIRRSIAERKAESIEERGDAPDARLVLHIVAAAKDMGVDIESDDAVAEFFTDLKILVTTQKPALAKAFKKYKGKDAKTLNRQASEATEREGALNETTITIGRINFSPKKLSEVADTIDMLRGGLRGGTIVEFEGQEDMPPNQAKALVSDLLTYFKALKDVVDPDMNPATAKAADKEAKQILKDLPKWVK